ncbi:MAG: hypothetical protein C5B43_04550 [Verrucomicrobia bacterium]|nr:MAG: hypothetical protein C5B43_04550 [Verrucomicrobiota bacterium]
MSLDESHNLLLNHLVELTEKQGLLSYKDFIEQVLFASGMGYYRKDKERVGRKINTDFYTAESLGSVFKQLVLASVEKILGSKNCKETQFVEIGAEPNNELIKTQEDRFGGYKSIRIGDDIEIPQKSILFANELLDAQAFHRLIYTNEQWHEIGVSFKNGKFSEELMPKMTDPVHKIREDLPKTMEEGYRLDLPLGAEDLLKKIVSQDWKGMILLFDYGFMWEDLINNHPEGTARAYYKHKQHNDLLINIGDQDITCHICWDRLSKILKENGFNQPKLERQEAFFVHHASELIELIINQSSEGKINKDKQTLLELIHPTHMGHKFQVLWACR